MFNKLGKKDLIIEGIRRAGDRNEDGMAETPNMAVGVNASYEFIVDASYYLLSFESVSRQIFVTPETKPVTKLGNGEPSNGSSKLPNNEQVNEVTIVEVTATLTARVKGKQLFVTPENLQVTCCSNMEVNKGTDMLPCRDEVTGESATSLSLNAKG